MATGEIEVTTMPTMSTEEQQAVRCSDSSFVGDSLETTAVASKS